MQDEMQHRVQNQDENEPLLKAVPLGHDSNPQLLKAIKTKTRRGQGWRVLGRFFNPLVDATTGYSFSNTIYVLCGLSNNETIENIIHFSPVFVFALSIGYEIYASARLSQNSHFLLGENDFKHLIAFKKNMTILYPDHKQDDDLLIMLTITNENRNKKTLVNDYIQAINYNFFRKLMERFQMSVFGLATLMAMLPVDTKSVYLMTAPFVIFFLLKAIFDKIESRWEMYQKSWQRLSLRARKFINVLNPVTNFFYDIMFTFGAINLCLFMIVVAASVSGGFNNLGMQIAFVANYYSPFYYVISDILFWVFLLSGSFYATIQQIPSHKPACDIKYIHLLKGINQSVFQSMRAIGTVFQSLVGLYGVWITLTRLGTGLFPLSVAALISILISILAGITTAINTFINYQERDPQRLGVFDEAVRRLQEQIQIEEGAIHSGNDNTIVNKEESIAETDFSIVKTTSNKAVSHWLCPVSWASFWGKKNGHDNPRLKEYSNVLYSESSGLDTTAPVTKKWVG